MPDTVQLHLKINKIYHSILRKWARQSTFTMSQILEILIADKTPAKMVPDPLAGWILETEEKYEKIRKRKYRDDDN